PITMADLYHFMPIGPQIAKGKIKGAQLKNQIEAAANGSLDPHVANWTGGWLFNFSGVTMDVDPYKPQGQRASNIMVNGQPLDPAATYTYASYWYAADPELINVVPATDIEVVKDSDGGALDGTEVVARYLQSLPDRTANTALNRNKLLTPLPGKTFGFGEVQPLRGVAR
ncbi:MAG: 5'-nucleotidase C-terminal domain-containing protein, partial [Rhodospirillales bacterium]|nr:5'-nucleotidase C-terminal domain-containing protein [Rhodospirillales bacterium]